MSGTCILKASAVEDRIGEQFWTALRTKRLDVAISGSTRGAFAVLICFGFGFGVVVVAVTILISRFGFSGF